MRMPLKTRDGVAEAPIEPGLRMLCEPCVFGPRLKLWRLIVPWKPLPIEIAGDLDPLAGLERLDGHRLADLQLAGRGTRPGAGARPPPALARWPRSALETLRSATGSNASWTAS